MTTKIDALTSKLAAALRERFPSPRDAIKQLGIDENLLTMETAMAGKSTQFAHAALMMTAPFIKPLLAKDAKIDLMPIFATLTPKTFKAASVKLALDSALKGKLAQDAEANIGHVAQILDHIEHMADPEVADESVSEEQHKAMAAAAGGNSNLGIPKKVGEEFMRADTKKGRDALPAFLKDKGLSEDDINEAMGMAGPAGEDEGESEEDKKKREAEAAEDAAMTAEERKAAADKRAHDEAEEKAKKEKEAEDRRARDAKMVTKDEMNTAIKAAVQLERANARAVAEAIEFVQPYVGKMEIAFDSEEGVLRQAATMLKVENADKINTEGLRTIIGMQPKAGARPPVIHGGNGNGPALGLDAASVDSFAKMFPGADRIKVGANAGR